MEIPWFKGLLVFDIGPPGSFASAGKPGWRDDLFEDRDQAASKYHLSGTGAHGRDIYEVHSQLLQQYPSAVALREADIDQLSQSLITDSYGHKREEFAKALIKAARFSNRHQQVPPKKIIIKQKIRFLLHQEEALQEITDMLNGNGPETDGRRYKHNHVHQGHRR